MIVSTTERGSYKRCRRQWMINSRSRWGLTRIVSSSPLALGTLVHDTLGLWLDMYQRYQQLRAEGRDVEAQEYLLPEGGLSSLFLQYAQKAIDTAKEVYERQVGIAMDSGELSPLWDSVAQGQCMLDNYQRRWKQPVPDGFEVVATEMRCMVPVPGTEHTSEWVWEREGAFPHTSRKVKIEYPSVRYHFLEGRLDGVLRETKTGKLYVIEHKTYGQRPREDVLFAQDQFLAYHWILLQMAAQMSLDPRFVAGVAYDGLWKRAAPPKVVDGHPGTLADLFCRRLITRPIQELVEFEQELAGELLEMASDPVIYKNRTSDGSCFWGCSDNQLCLAMSRGEDVDYLLRSQYKSKEADEDMDAAVEVA